jgi:hypothetical protein
MEKDDDSYSLGSMDSTLSLDSEEYNRDVNGYVEDEIFIVSEQSMCSRCSQNDEPFKTKSCSQCIRLESVSTPLRPPTKSDEPPLRQIRDQFARGKGGAALSALAKQSKVVDTIFWEDRRSCPNGICIGCKQSASVLYFSRFAMCKKCESVSVGIPLDHSKLPLIIGLRTEVDGIDLQLAMLAGSRNATRNPTTFLELTRRKDQIDRVLFDLIKDTK